MKIDLFNHFFPKRYFDQFIDTGGIRDIGKRVRNIQAIHDLEFRFKVMDEIRAAHGDYCQVLSLPAPPIEALGGPARYSERIGDETSVVKMHSGNGPHEEMDQRAIACFDVALVDVGLDRDDRLRQALHDYFSWATTTAMALYHDSEDDVPEGLDIPHWSWEGLVGAV